MPEGRIFRNAGKRLAPASDNEQLLETLLGTSVGQSRRTDVFSAPGEFGKGYSEFLFPEKGTEYFPVRG